MRKAREKTNFQIFLVSRFVCTLTIVVGSEYLVFFLANKILSNADRSFPGLSLFLLIALFLVPFLGAVYWFCKITMEEVERREEEQEEAQREYERKRNIMLSDIVHDLRTPITTISGYSKALNDGMVTSEEKKTEYLEAIENKSERMSEMINLLFDYVKMDSANSIIRKEKIDIAETLRKNAALIYSDVEDKEMELIIEIPEEPCLVEADELQISRVIINIINNSLRHNEAGTQIMLELTEIDGKKEIIISDNGECIEEEIALHIFEPFVVGDKSRRTKGGSGLGLSIAQKIVAMHGWKLSLIQNDRGYKKAFIININ